MLKKAFAIILSIAMIAAMWVMSTNAEERFALPEGDNFAVTTDVITDDFKTGDTIKVKLTINDIKEGLGFLDLTLKVEFNPSVLSLVPESITSSCDEINANDSEVDFGMSIDATEDAVELYFEDGNYVKGLTESGKLWVELVFTAKADNTQLTSDVLAFTSMAFATESVDYESLDGKGTLITAVLPTPEPSAAPTEVPTEAPTTAPTEEPTAAPTNSADPAPTNKPAPEKPEKDPDTFDIGLLSLAAVALSSCTVLGRKKQ
ncbi:MAG: hypothetical protein E7388_01810 [Ruminococcaceae bacterium]|nr:hypothetical protein [Oscillospiraceae bacterium]